MATRKSFALLFVAIGCLLRIARCQNAPDAAAAFDAAASAPPPQQTDQQVLDIFASPQGGNNTAAGDSNIVYGLSPNATVRLSYSGLGQAAYPQDPIPPIGAVNLGCGFGYVGSNFTSAIVGVGGAFFQQGFSCGRCILLQCDDASCEQQGRQAVAQIVDQCGECVDADLNIGYPLFEKISGRTANANPNLALSWQFIDCSPYINSTIKMLVKPGGNAYYQAFNFANSRQVITAVQVNGQLLRHETNNYWSWSPSSGAINPRGPFDFALLGANRQVLRVRLPTLRSSDLGVQFTMTVQAPAAEASVAAAAAAAEAAAPQAEKPPQVEKPPVAAASAATDGGKP